jgi:hypothetical protein
LFRSALDVPLAGELVEANPTLRAAMASASFDRALDTEL